MSHDCAGDTGITYVSLGTDLEEDAHCLCGHVPVWTRARKLQPAKWRASWDHNVELDDGAQ